MHGVPGRLQSPASFRPRHGAPRRSRAAAPGRGRVPRPPDDRRRPPLPGPGPPGRAPRSTSPERVHVVRSDDQRGRCRAAGSPLHRTCRARPGSARALDDVDPRWSPLQDAADQQAHVGEAQRDGARPGTTPWIGPSGGAARRRGEQRRAGRHDGPQEVEPVGEQSGSTRTPGCPSVTTEGASRPSAPGGRCCHSASRAFGRSRVQRPRMPRPAAQHQGNTLASSSGTARSSGSSAGPQQEHVQRLVHPAELQQRLRPRDDGSTIRASSSCGGTPSSSHCMSTSFGEHRDVLRGLQPRARSRITRVPPSALSRSCRRRDHPQISRSARRRSSASSEAESTACAMRHPCRP